MNALAHTIYRFDDFQLDLSKRQLLRAGQPVVLQGKAFELLRTLVEHRGQVLTKEELCQLVWPDQIVEESNLTVHMSAVRKALGERASQPHYITTISGRGYRFAAELQQWEGETEDVVIEQHTLARVVVESETENSDQTGHAPAEDTGTLSLLGTVVNHETTRLALSEREAASGLMRGATKPRRAWVWLAVVAAALIVVSAPAVFLYRSQHSRTPPAVVSFQNVTLTQLTTNSKAALFAIHPDGKLFVYVSEDGGQQSLWLGHVSGGEPVSLRPPTEVTYRSLNFSPDGSSLYYVLSSDEYPQGALFKMPAFGGVPEKLRENIDVKIAFAPDMKRFAHTRHNREKKSSSLVIAETDGSSEREIATRPETLPFRSLSPSWSPDGTKIAASAATDESGESYEVFVVTLEDGQTRPLTALAWNRVDGTAWLPDGSGLVIVGNEKGVWESFRLWHVSYPDGAARRILSDLDTYGSSISLSADGQSLTAIQTQRITNVWVAPSANLSQAKQITNGSVGRRDGWGNLDWTPDGKLLYGAIVRESLSIWRMEADGKDQKQLTSAGYRDSHVSATADGRYMIFHSNRSGSMEIWRALIDGSEMKQLTAGSSNEEPSVSPDGKWIVYTSLRDGLRTLWRVSLDGGDAVRLADRPASWPRISPDGKLIACAYAAPDSSQTQIAIMPVEGGRPVNLFDVPRLANFNLGLRWTPDGKAVTYRDWANGIWRQPLDGGAPARLPGLPGEKLYSYDWSRDGKQFAFVRGSELRDVVLIRNFR